MVDPARRREAPAALAQRWLPPGPIAAAFAASEAPNPVIIGPVGSGKTTQALQKILVLANRVPALDVTVSSAGKRVKRCRVAIVARTYRVMWKNLLPSYFKVFPKDWGKWTGGEGEPWVHKFALDVPNTDLRFEIEVIGLAVGDTPLDDLTRGLEITGAYIYEFDTLVEDTIEKFKSRCGRYPNMPSGALQDLVPRQVWCDANAFDPDHWAYDACFGDTKPAGREVFLQPGGRTAQAENVQNVGKRYYLELVDDLKPWQVARLVDNRFVPDRPGFVVYNDWNPMLHEAQGLIEPERTLPLIIGVDQGMRAAAEILQRRRKNVWRAIDEVCAPKEQGWTAKKFAGELTDLLDQNYAGFAVIAIVDPAAKAGTGVGDGGDEASLSWLREFAEHFPFPVKIAISNRVKGVTGGVTAVRDLLTTLDEGQPGLLVSSRCKVLRKGFNGAYRFKAKPNEPGVASAEIDKTYEANAQDGFRYAVHTVECLPEMMFEAQSRVRGGARGPQDGPRAMDIIF